VVEALDFAACLRPVGLDRQLADAFAGEQVAKGAARRVLLLEQEQQRAA
jgi:hypothetical protein